MTALWQRAVITRWEIRNEYDEYNSSASQFSDAVHSVAFKCHWCATVVQITSVSIQIKHRNITIMFLYTFNSWYFLSAQLEDNPELLHCTFLVALYWISLVGSWLHCKSSVLIGVLTVLSWITTLTKLHYRKWSFKPTQLGDKQTGF